MRKLILLAAAASIGTQASAANLFSTDFDGNTSIGAGIGITGTANGALETAATGSWNAAGWAGNYFANRTTGNPAGASSVTFSNLASHTTISLGFILGFLESWDSNSGQASLASGLADGDHLGIFADGVQIADLTANNASGSRENFMGSTLLPDAHYAQVNGNNFYTDTLVDTSTSSFASFAHSASSLTLSFQAYGTGWQGSTDEGWGIDNLVISYDAGVSAVPEPATWAMMIGGFGLAGGALRRRRAPALRTA